MTDVVEITSGNASDGYQLARSIQNAGATDPGWIVPAADCDLSDRNASTSIADGEFEHTNTTGLDVTINHGEAYGGGTWFTRDVATTVTLAASTSGQVVYAGFDASAIDTVIIGLSSAFATEDPKLPLYTFATNTSTVSGSTDDRVIGATLSRTNIVADILDAGDGSTLDTVALIAAATSGVGTLGDANNELFRAYGTQTDALAQIDTGDETDGDFQLCWNCYYDGDWRYIEAGKRACRITMRDLDIIHRVAENTAPSAGALVGDWRTFDFDFSGDLYIESNLVYDHSETEVPKARLGGPASSLSAYPLATADIADNAITNDKLASGVGSEWTELGSTTNTNASSVIDYQKSFGTTYDMYRLEAYIENHTAEEAYFNLRLNGDATSVYYFDWYNAGGNSGTSATARTQFEKLGGTRAAMGAVAGSEICMQTIEIACPAAVNNPTVHYPVISVPVHGVSMNVDYLMNGTFKRHVSAITEVRFWTTSNSTGKVRVLGRDLL